MSATDIRCPACKRLLAKRRSDGVLDIRFGKRWAAKIQHGQVTCLRCNVSVTVEPLRGAHILRAMET